MSFWRTFGFHTISPIENILDRESFTLEELLEEEDVLQETKAQNKKLIDFFVKPDVLAKFIFFLTAEADENADAKRKQKYPFVCAEILCSEVWSLCEAFFETDSHANALLDIFDRADGALNPVLAGHVCKVCSSLLHKKSAEFLNLMKRRDNLIGKLMRHLGTAPVMGLLLKIIVTSEDPTVEGNGAVLAWLCESGLIGRLVDGFDPALSPDLHENVATALVEIIVAFSQHPGSPLLAQLESANTARTLFAHATADGASPFGLAVLNELLNRSVQENLNATSNPEELPPYVRLVLGGMPRLLQLLRTPTGKRFQMTYGEVAPLGFYRLKLVELFATLGKLKFQLVDEGLMRTGILGAVLDLFFELEWNNFLHMHTEQLFVHLLIGPHAEVKRFLVSECKLAERIVRVTRDAETSTAAPGLARKGYMAFVSSIASALVNEAGRAPELAALLTAVPGWDAYVAGALSETKRVENAQLAGPKPSMLEPPPADDSAAHVLKYLASQGFQANFTPTEGDDDDDEALEFDMHNDNLLARAIFAGQQPPLVDEEDDEEQDLGAGGGVEMLRAADSPQNPMDTSAPPPEPPAA
jgi:serine/threonine-protein phosphatase 6 regulatory subunit 3